MKPTHVEMIYAVIKDLHEPFTTKEIIEAVIRKYSAIRSINKESLKTDIAGCCVNLKSHRHLPDLPILLVSIGRGNIDGSICEGIADCSSKLNLKSAK